MGYRSSWYLAIEGDTAKKIKQKIILGETLESVSSLLAFAENELEEEIIYFEAHDIKMYESYPDVAAFYAWLNTLDAEEYKYYELGEEEGDISHRGFAYELLRITTDVERY